jgi:hypothetical protein
MHRDSLPDRKHMHRHPDLHWNASPHQQRVPALHLALSRLHRNPDNCTSCIAGHNLTGNTCTPSANCTGTQVLISNVCQPCTSPCQSCFGTQANCTSCIGTHFLTGNTCNVIPTCTGTQVLISNVCQPCTSPCQGCFGTQAIAPHASQAST